MTMVRRQWLAAAGALPLLGAAAANPAGQQLYRRRSRYTLDEVLLDVDTAITNHNYRITGRNRIGTEIAERLGEPFPAADVIQFCNLEYARRLLEIDPGFIVYMPCQIAVYQTDDGVMVGTWLLPPQPAPADTIIERINTLLRGIVDFATL